MSDLILFVILAVLSIAVLAVTLAYVVHAHAKAQAEWRNERERLITAVLSRNVAEFAMAENRMQNNTPQRQDERNYEAPVGL